MKKLCIVPLLLLLLPVFLAAQDKGDVVYGSFKSALIRMVHLRADGTFLMFQGTDEQRGTYTTPRPDRIVLESSDGGKITCKLEGDVLTVEGRDLPRWKGGKTAAAFLGTHIRDVVTAIESKAKIQEGILSLSCIVRQYRERTGSYLNFSLPIEFREKNYATYEITVQPNSIAVTVTSLKVDGGVKVTIGEDGRPAGWTYFGEFQ